jgi:hypothetical protein
MRMNRIAPPEFSGSHAICAGAGIFTILLGLWFGYVRFLGPDISLADLKPGDLPPPVFSSHAIRTAIDREIARDGDAASRPADFDTMTQRVHMGIVALLSLRPSDALLWASLAQIDERGGARPDAITASLRMSYLVGRLEQQAVLKRIAVGLRMRDALQPGDMEMLEGDIRQVLSQEPPHRMIGYLALAARGLDVKTILWIRKFVALYRPDWLKTFDSWLRRPPDFDEVPAR